MFTLNTGIGRARTLAAGILACLSASSVAHAAESAVDPELLSPSGDFGAAGLGRGDAQFGNGVLTLVASDRFAGAIEHLYYNGTEFIDAFDHGRGLQMAVSLDPGPECLMPTEAGSDFDGTGPTSSSVLNSYQVGPASWATSTSPAYWLTRARPLPYPWQYCTDKIVSPEIFRKEIQVGVPGYPQVIRYMAHMQLAADYPLAYAELPTIYLQENFTRHFRMDPGTGETWEYQKIHSYPTHPDHPAEEHANTVLIFSDANGLNAIAMWSPYESRGGDFQYRGHMFDFSGHHGGSPAENTSKLTVTRSWGGNEPALIESETYIAVGTLDKVRCMVKGLYAASPTNVSRAWPDVARRVGDPLPPVGTCGAVTDISTFDQSNPDVETPFTKQLAISSDGRTMIERVYDNGWKPWRSFPTSAAIGLEAIRSFSQGPDTGLKPKQFFVTRDGKTIRSRTYVNGAWGPQVDTSVASLGIPNLQRIRSFDQTGPDPAIGNKIKQMLLADDGNTIYYRYSTPGSTVWTPWTTGYASGLGLPSAPPIKSISQGKTPNGEAKFDVLSGDGRMLYTRVYTNGVWGAWKTVAVGALGMSE
ncbi:hypothetical protein [Tahibacter amnicola]|uniref:Uncharacterized protein n=1 Tax=Tahibacter amnicola TaxID=2976241 RepID=A0ABY6BEZ6_9GAMM|nr:hypothetical protein [Tahibacter amnicola]UXI66925.1 hypothetical protein N4264_19525 [Tahibacter amnicola]